MAREGRGVVITVICVLLTARCTTTISGCVGICLNTPPRAPDDPTLRKILQQLLAIGITM